MQIFIEYLKVFAVGGILCVIGQLLIDKTNLTPGRILVSFVTAGVLLSALGLYKPIAEKDLKKIAILLKFYRSAFKIIALVVSFLGVVVSFIIPKIIRQ